MVQLLLHYIRAEREGLWPLHLSATAQMAPYFYAMDTTNYARWLPEYLGDMSQLPVKAAEIHEEFVNGNHSISRSTQPFSQVWTDMALEQSVNLDSKSKGGIIGISLKLRALERWFLTVHERAAITTCIKEMCSLGESDKVSHKETGSRRHAKDEEDVRKMVTTLSTVMTDPFNIEDVNDDDVIPLVNLATGVVMPDADASRLVSSLKEGEEHMNKFVHDRLDTNEVRTWDPLPRLKVKTFKSLSKKKNFKAADEKIQTVIADRDLFGRLLIAANSRDVNLREVLSYELSTVPYSLAHADGTLRKSTKSILLTELEKMVNVKPTLPATGSTIATAQVMDGMAIVQILKVWWCFYFWRPG